MVQALAVRVIGPKVTSFGAGPDGGREATWDGDAPALGQSERWDGYGVLQAKFAEFPGKPAANLKWISKTMLSELTDWAKKESNRSRKPDYILFATNVRLSGVPGKGKDALRKLIAERIESLKLPIKDFRTWDYDDISRLLDDSPEIRRTYGAFITPGDVLASILDNVNERDRRLSGALMSSTARLLIEDSHIGLTQAGSMGDSRVTIADVFVDLPVDARTVGRRLEPDSDDGDAGEPLSHISVVEPSSEFEGRPFSVGVAANLIRSLNVAREPSSDVLPPHTVLVGGPGQGKSTVTQWLSQLYRREFLRGTDLESNPDVAQVATGLDARVVKIDMPAISARRWPFRIVLTDFADFLADHPDSSLFHFIAERLSGGSAVSLESSDIVRWLETYPWMLVIDGLDEVPQSSNRDQVVRAIRDFFIEVDVLGGDVVAIATTRPQGYANEFPAKSYRHIELEPLDPNTALRCAQALLEIRFGGAQSTIDKVLSRLERASQEEATARLFSSPLQVTILTVLLEKLGKPPGDRWRLFSAYYGVISSREQEKSGELSELLQKYESDINAIHMQVGYVLQHRSAEAGETSSSISKLEFEGIVRSQFSDQGHDQAEVDALIDDFSRLLTDRLVFLTYGSADRLGFELRSLQEFMAAEYVVHQPEAEVPDRLYQLARSSHWRNVLLFAIGGIFANRPPLRAEVTLLCATLNHEAGTYYGVPLGSVLAIDILADGSCNSMPKYARELAAIAMQLVQADTGLRQLSQLLVLSDQHSLSALRAAARSTTPALPSEWIARAYLLVQLQEIHGDSDEHLSNLVASLSSSEGQAILLYAWQEGDPTLAEASERFLEACEPSDLLRVRSARGAWYPSLQEEEVRPLWVRHLSEIAFDMRRESHWTSIESSIAFRYTPLNSNVDAWRWVLDHSPQTQSWKAFRIFASFALAPTSDSLAEALESLSGQTAIPRAPDALPWVLRACLRYASTEAGTFCEHSVEAWCGALRDLASRARDGELGSVSDWLAAESVTADGSALRPEQLVGWSKLRVGEMNPIGPLVATVGLPPQAAGFQVHLPDRRRDGEDELAQLADQAMDLSSEFVDQSHARDLRNLLEFIVAQCLEMISTSNREDVAAITPYVNWSYESLRKYPHSSMRWVGWLGSAAALSPSAEILDLLGQDDCVVFDRTAHEGALREQFVALLAADVSVSLVYLVAQVDPKLFLDLEDEVVTQARDRLADTPHDRWLAIALNVRDLVMEAVELSDSQTDAVRSIVQGEVGPFDLMWLSRIVQARTDKHFLAHLLPLLAQFSPQGVRSIESVAWTEALASPVEVIEEP